MKKVLFVSHNHPAIQPGGAEGHAYDLHMALEEGGRFEPVFLARAERTPQRHTRIPIGSVDGRPNHYLMYTEWNNWDFIYGRSSDRSVATRFFRDFLLGQQPDVIHFQHTRFLGYDMIRAARNALPEVPILHTLHDYLPICHRAGQMVRTNANELCQEESPRRCHECFPEITPQTFYMRKRFIQSHLSLVDLFIAPSDYVKATYADWGIPEERIRVVPYARPAVNVAPDVPEKRARNRFAFFGQFTPFKGVDVLLRAMAILGDEFDGHLWVHAANLQHQPPEFQDDIRELLEETRETVTDAGPYEPGELPGLLDKVDWVIVPSIWWETGPLVVLEAFQHGRPVIASDIGGMSEKVEERVSGLHFRTGDADSLAEVIGAAAQTPGLWDRLHAGIPRVYDIRDHASLMSDIYEELIDERARAGVTAPSLPDSRKPSNGALAEAPPSRNGAKAKPRVLYVSANHPDVRPGGAEGFALDLYHAIRDKGDFDPIFLARSGPPLSSLVRYHWGTALTAVNDDPNQYLLYTDPEHWDYLFQRSADKQMLVRFFREFLLEQKPDVVHLQHSLFLGHDMIRVTRNTLPHAPILYMLHDYLPICHRDGQMVRTESNQLCTHESPRRCNECFPTVPPEMFYMRKRFIQSQFSLVDLFIAPSEHVRDEYVKWGLPAEKIRVEPYACRPLPDPPGPGPDRPRNRFAFFGQFTPYKGADVLLEAMCLLGEEFDGQLSIHGANLDRQPKEFREQFKELLDSVPSTVTFAGPYDHDRELGQLMARTDWVVVPSIWWETGPLVVLEAFLHGRPVIASDIGGMSEKVTDGVSGLHFRRADPESLAGVLERAAKTPGLWEELRAGIPAVYDITDHAAAMNDVYKSLIAARQAERDRLVSVP